MKWLVRYNDKTELHQIGQDGVENSYSDIDRAKLESFALYSNDGRHVFELHLDPGQRLIYRKRIEQRTGESPFVVYMVGWQKTVNGTNVQSIAYITESEQVHMAGAWKEDHPWFYSIVPVPCEVENDV